MALDRAFRLWPVEVHSVASNVQGALDIFTVGLGAHGCSEGCRAPSSIR